MLDFVQTHSLADKSNYDYVAKRVDIDELINYEILEIFIGNTDWPGKNNKYWRERSENGKWRWILYDTDFGFGLMNEDHVEDNNFNTALRSDRKATLIFRKLLENRDFKNRFASKFYTQLNYTFLTERVDNMIKAIHDKLSPEMARHYQHWSRYKNWISVSNWEDSVQSLYDYAAQRNQIVRNQLRNRFSLSGHNQLEVVHSDGGVVAVDGIPMQDDFRGEYFDNAKVTLEATPEKGYKFLRWSNGMDQPSITIELKDDRSIKAEFTKKEVKTVPKIVINEINYKSEKEFDTGDWIELYNNDTKDIDISGWEVKDDKDSSSFLIPAATILKAGDYIVLTEKSSDFTKLVSGVTTVGDFTFGLGKKSDAVRLFDSQKSLVDSVYYDKKFPNASGNGKTLSLVDPNADNAAAENWVAADAHGTPGARN